MAMGLYSSAFVFFALMNHKSSAHWLYIIFVRRMSLSHYTRLCCCLYLLAVALQIGHGLRAHVVNSTEYRDVLSPHRALLSNSFKVEGVLHFFNPNLEAQQCRIVKHKTKESVVVIYRQSDISEICEPMDKFSEEKLCVGVIQVLEKAKATEVRKSCSSHWNRHGSLHFLSRVLCFDES